MPPRPRLVLTTDPTDDLFSRPPRTTRLQLLDEITITCRVCSMRAKVTIDNEALLCGPCRTDTVATRAHVESTIAAAERRWQAAVEAFDAQAESVPQWAAVQAAERGPLFAEAWRRRKAEGGALGQLLEAKERLDDLSDEMQRRRAWAESALREIDAYEHI